MILIKPYCHWNVIVSLFNSYGGGHKDPVLVISAVASLHPGEIFSVGRKQDELLNCNSKLESSEERKTWPTTKISRRSLRSLRTTLHRFILSGRLVSLLSTSSSVCGDETLVTGCRQVQSSSKFKESGRFLPVRSVKLAPHPGWSLNSLWLLCCYKDAHNKSSIKQHLGWGAACLLTCFRSHGHWISAKSRI